jgi:hypothetical protein
MMDFTAIKGIAIPEGKTVAMTCSGATLWRKKQEQTRLPLEYQEVEYIIVPSGAWFNTGIVPSGDKWIFETEMYAGTWGSNGYYYFGVRQTRDYDTMYCPFFVQSGFRMYLSGTKTASAGGAKNTWYKLKSEIEDGLQNLYINDALKMTDDLPITTTYTLPMYLFGVNFHGGKYSQTVTGRIKYLKATKENVPVSELVACYRKSDGKAGLYDLVAKKFLANSGSGTITVGPDVY